MERRIIGLDTVLEAIKIREGGGRWTEVEARTGFNGATLRPHINRYLSREVVRKERGTDAQVTAEDRVDSPYAVVETVELTAESILSARLRGMSWYGIAEALGVSEAKAKGLCPSEGMGRIYAGRKVRPVEVEPEPTEEELKAAKRSAAAKKAAATRAAKKAAKAA